MNTHRASLLFAGLLCAATSAGCRGTTTSDKVETKDIRATIEAVDDGWAGDITVSIDLDVARKDNNDHLSLAKGDTLTATTGKKSKTFEESWGADGYYKADVLEESPELTVALSRESHESALGTFGVMPDALEFSGYGGEVISRSLDFIELDLPATAFDKSVDFSGSCVNSLSFNVGTAASTITVWPGDLYSSIDTDECNVTIRVTTTSFGEVDPALHPSSTFTLIRERETTFYSVP